jgi:hypothetical protein
VVGRESCGLEGEVDADSVHLVLHLVLHLSPVILVQLAKHPLVSVIRSP